MDRGTPHDGFGPERLVRQDPAAWAAIDEVPQTEFLRGVRKAGGCCAQLPADLSGPPGAGAPGDPATLW